MVELLKIRRLSHSDSGQNSGVFGANPIRRVYTTIRTFLSSGRVLFAMKPDDICVWRDLDATVYVIHFDESMTDIINQSK